MNWGYLVVVSGFVMYTLFYGILFNYNLLNIEFKNTFNASATETALPGSIAITTSAISASPVTFLYQAIGHRKTTGLGVVLCSASLFLTSFIQNINIVCITYGVMFGLGCASIHLPLVDITSTFFRGRHLTRALCFQFVGVSIGLSMASGIEWLYSVYSWRVALRIFAVIFTVIGIFSTAAVFFAIRNQGTIQGKEDDEGTKKSRKPRLQRYSVLLTTFSYIVSMPAFLMLCLAVVFSYLSLGIYLEDHLNLSKSSISLILSLMGAGDIVGRLLISFGAVHVTLSTTMQYVLVLLLTAAFTCAIPFTSSLTPITALLTALGATRGILFAAIVSAAIDVTPPTLNAEGIALMYLFFGIGTFLTPYVTDSIYDVTGNYRIGIFICVGMYFGAAILFTIGHLYKQRFGYGSNTHNVRLSEGAFERIPPIDEKKVPQDRGLEMSLLKA